MSQVFEYLLKIFQGKFNFLTHMAALGILFALGSLAYYFNQQEIIIVIIGFLTLLLVKVVYNVTSGKLSIAVQKIESDSRLLRNLWLITGCLCLLALFLPWAVFHLINVRSVPNPYCIGLTLLASAFSFYMVWFNNKQINNTGEKLDVIQAILNNIYGCIAVILVWVITLSSIYLAFEKFQQESNDCQSIQPNIKSADDSYDLLVLVSGFIVVDDKSSESKINDNLIINLKQAQDYINNLRDDYTIRVEKIDNPTILDGMAASKTAKCFDALMIIRGDSSIETRYLYHVYPSVEGFGDTGYVFTFPSEERSGFFLTQKFDDAMLFERYTPGILTYELKTSESSSPEQFIMNGGGSKFILYLTLSNLYLYSNEQELSEFYLNLAFEYTDDHPELPQSIINSVNQYRSS